jgi:hypothetical protein
MGAEGPARETIVTAAVRARRAMLAQATQSAAVPGGPASRASGAKSVRVASAKERKKPASSAMTSQSAQQVTGAPDTSNTPTLRMFVYLSHVNQIKNALATFIATRIRTATIALAG